jgi:ligand-binding SRPBCC domain-containing protein
MFVDEMVKGPFHTMKHFHKFKGLDQHTLMVDEFKYTSPLGILGKVADFIFLKSYMTKLLTQRNYVLKNVAESWAESGAIGF